MPKKTRQSTILSAVSQTTLSGMVDVQYADKVTLYLKATGTTIFTIQGSIDGVVFKPQILMIPDSPNSSTQNIMRVVSATLNNESRFYALDLSAFGFVTIQVLATVSTGTASASALIEY